MKAPFTLFLIGAFILLSCERQKETAINYSERPKLVVGIIVDQMRAEYLYRFYEKFGEGGFKRMMNQGYNVQNTHYNYVPTYTAPGHASVYTGTTPSQHGIIGNNWFNLDLMEVVYCAYDSTVETVGSSTEQGKHSPENLLATTITDELRIFSSFRSKSIGISIKDRGAIFPAGRAANAAYWYDSDEGKFITSNFYMHQLPDWVEAFNQSGKIDDYLNQSWNTLLPIEEYVESTKDDVPFERLLGGQENSTFPYDLPAMKDEMGYKLLPNTPFGNSIVVDMAIETLNHENMGQGSFTDFLAISFSSTDYIGHSKGTHSVEIQDTYLRLDRDLERIFNELDAKVGKGNYLVFLTADHAGAPTPAYMNSVNISAGGTPNDEWLKELRVFVQNEFGTADIIASAVNQQIYFDRRLISEKGLSIKVVRRKVADFILNWEEITGVFTYEDFLQNEYQEGVGAFFDRGFHANRSGDVFYALKPGYVSGGHYADKGTTHASHFSYDTHVPNLWYGWKIEPGTTYEPYNIVDIAATLALKLHLPMPNACTGEPIQELL